VLLKPDPLSPSEAVAQVTPEPRDQFPKVTPDGGVVQVAVGVFGVVTVPPPPTVTVVCPQPVVAKVIKAAQIAIAWNLKRDFETPDFRP
jgi:hypothetical protein